MSSENIIESLISKEEKQCFMSNFSTLREAACRYQWGRGFSVWGEVIAEDNVTSDGELLGWVTVSAVRLQILLRRYPLKMICVVFVA